MVPIVSTPTALTGQVFGPVLPFHDGPCPCVALRPLPLMRSATTQTPFRRRVRFFVAVLVISGAWIPPAGAAPTAPKPSGDAKLRELQSKRDQVRAAKAKSASQVDALKASDAEVQKALADLSNNIEGQSDLLEESKRAVTAAETEQAAAEASVQRSVEELSKLRTSIKQQAIQAFVDGPTDETLELLSAESLAEAARERTLRSVRASSDLDAADRYRKVQQDLEIARGKAAAAAKKANDRRADVADRLARLEAAQAEQEAFSAQVEARIEASLAEAQSLAELDGELAGQISNRQSEIAKALAAQRAAATRRGRSSPVPTGGSAITYPNTDGAGIVDVRGIKVHESMASNLASLLAAAEAAGVQLSGGGYRNPAGQIAVRRSNCGSSNYAIYQAPASSCSPPTARPGQSMHERGLAIDFTSGGRTLTRSSAAFAWMKANAGNYGFYNLPSEPWHWSANGN